MFFFFFQAEDGIRDSSVTGVQTCALPISTFPGGIRLATKNESGLGRLLPLRHRWPMRSSRRHDIDKGNGLRGTGSGGTSFELNAVAEEGRHRIRVRFIAAEALDAIGKKFKEEIVFL